MVPKTGDVVRMTEEYIRHDTNFENIKGRKLEVMKVALDGISHNGPSYVVYFVGEGCLRKITIDKDGQHDGFVVFELIEAEGYNPTRNESSEDDICGNCGVMGEVKGMCCVCPSCGSLIWGI